MSKKRLSKNQIDTLFDQILNQGKSGMDVYEEIRPESKCSDFPEEVHPDPVSEDIQENVAELEEHPPEEHPPEIPEHVQEIIDELAKAPRSFFTFEEVADSLPRQNREKVIHNCEALIDNEHPDIESMWWEGKEMISYRTAEYETKIISVGSRETNAQPSETAEIIDAHDHDPEAETLETLIGNKDYAKERLIMDTLAKFGNQVRLSHLTSDIFPRISHTEMDEILQALCSIEYISIDINDAGQKIVTLLEEYD